MKKAFYTSLAACFIAATVLAQQSAPQKFKVFNGHPGITKKLSELKAGPPAQQTVPMEPRMNPKEFNLKEFRKFDEELKTKSPGKAGVPDNAAADNNSSLAEAENTGTQKVWSNFLATTFDEFPYFAPPDPNGAVGPSQVVTITNNMLKVFEKPNVTEPPLLSYKATLHTPAPAEFSIPTYGFFYPVLADGSYSSDPHVRFDRLTKRWFITAIEINASLQNNNILLAISDGERITDQSSFIFYYFPSDLLAHSPDAPPPFFDYPRLGVDQKSVLIGGSAFFSHATACGDVTDSIYSVGFAIDKKALLHGSLIGNVVQLGRLDGTSGSGVIIPQGVYNDNPTAPKSFFAGISYNLDGIVLAGLSYDKAGNLVDVSETTVAVPAYQYPRDVTALGSPMPIDPQDTRLFEASIYKNKLTGKSALWTAHAIGVTQSGDYVSGDDFVTQARTGARWYQIGDIYTKPHVSQSGTVYDDAQASGRRAIQYFNPSIAANGQGNAVLGGTTSAYNRYLNAFIAGRYYSDAAGTLGAPQKVTASNAIYALNFGSYVDRWGDYSQTVVDPLDNQTIWSFQEYVTSDDNFALRAIQIKAPPPATPLPLDPLSNTDNIWVTLKGVSVDHSGFFDPGTDKGGPGYNRLSVKATGGLLASSVKFVSPTEIRFRLNLKGKPAGNYTLVITNPDGQLVTTNFEIAAATSKTAVVANGLLQKEIEKYSSASSVLPNPTAGEFKLQITAAKNWNARIVLLDVSGKQLSESQHSLTQGTNELSLSLAPYDKGTYLAAVYNENHVLIAIQKIVKQ